MGDTTKNLVLGGSGTIGSALCRHLAEIGEEAINLDLKEGFDLRTDSMDAYKNVDYVWFLAWDVGGAKYLTDEKNLLNILRNNTLICERVFAFLEETGIPFMFASSQLAETDNTYGITKLLGEEWTKLLGGKTVKFWNVYGWEEPGERSHVIPDLVISAIRNGKIELMTDGEEERQFIYMDDCVRNLVKIRASDSKVVHVTNGRWLKIKEVAQIIADMLNVPFIPGTIKGYNNKKDPDPSHKIYEFPTDIREGIRQIREKAEAYLAAKG